MENRKKRYLIISVLVLIEIVSIFLTYKSGISKLNNNKLKMSDHAYAIMLETGLDTEEYEEYDNNRWPGVGYILNRELTECVDEVGNKMEGILSFDNETKIATVRSKKETYCYLYFDFDPAPEDYNFEITDRDIIKQGTAKYTKKRENEVSISWTDKDIKYYCLTEEKDNKKCEWKPTNTVNSITTNYTFSNNEDGTKIVASYIKDEGGSSTREEDTIVYDKTGPTVAIAPTGELGTNNWYKNLRVTISANDFSGVGVEKIYYCVKEGTNCDIVKNGTNVINGASGTIEIDTKSTAQIICAQGVDKLGNEGAKQCSASTYKVDKNDPDVTFTIGENTIGNKDGVKQWYKTIKIKVTGTDSGSGIDSIKYCRGNCNPETSATATIANNSQVAIENNLNGQKICVLITDKSGRKKTKCSDIYYADNIPPVCGTVNKTGGVGTTSGVTGNVGCSDGTSGCINTNFPFINLRGTTTIEIKDKAGNTNGCSVPITPQRQIRTRSCTGHSQYWCGSYCAYPANDYACGNSQHGSHYCAYSAPFGDSCNRVGSCCLGYADRYCEGGCNAYSAWSGWSDTGGCSGNEFTECQTIYR